VERHRAVAAHGSTRAEAQEQPADHQRHVLHPPRGLAVARPARSLRPLHHGLQPLQPLAEGGHLGQADGRHREGSRRQGADDRLFDRARSSARLRGQKKSGVPCVGRSRGGVTTKIHARVDAKGRPVRILISPGNDHDITCAEVLLKGLEPRAVVIADKGYDADSVRRCIRDQGAIPNIPNRSNRKKKYRWKKAVYRQRNLVERFFNKLKQFRRIATRYDKLGATFFAFIQLASIRIYLRSIESTA
jgi:transposase